MLFTGLLAVALVMQGESRPRPAITDPKASMRATAIRASAAPAIDGLDTDPVWRNAVAFSDFVEFTPREGNRPRFQTEFRVAYDQKNFYVFVRAFDDDPSQIKTSLARRDARPPTDQIKIIIDSYFDRRSGYEFAVNPGGVKRDYIIYNDNQEDGAWDAVWDVSTSIDSLGWTAEFKIPLSQLRYSNAATHTFGFGVWRDIDRHRERVSWPAYRETQQGISSQLGELSGITGLSSPRRFEMAPYAVTKNVTVADGDGFGHEQQLTAGADFKYGVSSNMTLSGTVNPDFGQVEADPAVLNLSAFETFFQERRPFFLEGVGLFRFEINCSAVNDCGRENLFYSRRIGRAPQLTDAYGDATSSTSTTIIGAGKLSGRLPGGLSIGVLDAVTQRETGLDNRTIEPASNYAVVRVSKDLRNGETSLGGIGTFVNRNNDEWTSDLLRSSAVVGGLDLRHRFLNKQYQIQARLVGSRVDGSAAAMDLTQQNAVHAYQRPDADLDYDPTRTSLTGDFEQVSFGKVSGNLLRFETSYQRTSPGFEINDLGFLNRADKQNQSTWAQLSFNKPAAFYRRLFWNMNQWNDWTADGLPLDRAFNTNVHTELKNSWWLHAGGTIGGLGEMYCDRCARGGPAVRNDEAFSAWAGFNGDDRKTVIPELWFNFGSRDEGRSTYVSISPYVTLRLSSQWNMSLGGAIERNKDDRQWYDNITDAGGVTHYTFAYLDQKTLSFTGRMDYTMSPNLTFQLYVQPFVTKGEYSNLRELDQPRAADYDDRMKPFTGISNPGGFNVKQFRSNAVIRWEYRPGSALYVVWQQGRESFEPQFGGRSFRGDFSELFRSHPDNTFLIKMSYWFDR